jgi:hypothetical protein
MLQQRLNDAAIALHKILAQENINFGIFGGYAIGAIGGVRESKDVDCLASTSKEQIIQLLNGKEGFVAVPQNRTITWLSSGLASRIERMQCWLKYSVNSSQVSKTTYPSDRHCSCHLILINHTPTFRSPILHGGRPLQNRHHPRPDPR